MNGLHFQRLMLTIHFEGSFATRHWQEIHHIRLSVVIRFVLYQTIIFDETTNVSQWAHKASKIQRGHIVFLKSDKEMLDAFFAKDVFHRISHPFVLVTHNSDASVPGVDYRWALADKRILAWFTQNPDLKHSKLVPIPIGIANHRWAHGNVTVFKKSIRFYRKPFKDRTTLLYVNFQVATNHKIRSEALKWTRSIVNTSRTPAGSLETYLEQMGDAKFVLSPPGTGLDCHRTWEALMMGATPIVLRSPLDSLFVNESVLIIDSWKQLSVTYLSSFRYNPVPSQKLLAEYWYKRLLHASGHSDR